jgi:hypothetical protein
MPSSWRIRQPVRTLARALLDPADGAAYVSLAGTTVRGFDSLDARRGSTEARTRLFDAAASGGLMTRFRLASLVLLVFLCLGVAGPVIAWPPELNPGGIAGTLGQPASDASPTGWPSRF